jgi:hypothetical protein
VAWGTVAAGWLLILFLNWQGHDAAASNMRRITPAGMAEALQQKRALAAELAEATQEAADETRPRSAAPAKVFST